MEVLLKGYTLILLIFLSVIDIKKRKIPGVILFASFLISLLSIILVKRGIPTEYIFGMAIGILFIMTSLATRGQIGMGDGITLVITGVLIGFWSNLLMILYALFAAGITAIILMVFKKVKRKERIPFLPFLLLGYTVVISTGKL